MFLNLKEIKHNAMYITNEGDLPAYDIQIITNKINYPHHTDVFKERVLSKRDTMSYDISPEFQVNEAIISIFFQYSNEKNGKRIYTEGILIELFYNALGEYVGHKII